MKNSIKFIILLLFAFCFSQNLNTDENDNIDLDLDLDSILPNPQHIQGSNSALASKLEEQKAKKNKPLRFSDEEEEFDNPNLLHNKNDPLYHEQMLNRQNPQNLNAQNPQHEEILQSEQKEEENPNTQSYLPLSITIYGIGFSII